VPYFVPTLSRKQSQKVAERRECQSPLLARRINTIAKHRTQSSSPFSERFHSTLDRPAHERSIPLDGWELKVNSGQPDVSTTKDGDAVVLHFNNGKSSFSLEKGVGVDAAKLPYLAWHWKVTQVPKRGHFRHFWSDDQATQVWVAFDDRHMIS
jgi:DUF3047 family protein